MNAAQIQRYARPLKRAAHLAAWLYLLFVAVETWLAHLSPLGVVDRLGFGALTCLALCLACTPLNTIFNFPPVRRLRRQLGLYAFFFACLHLLVLLAWDYGLDWAGFWDAIRHNLSLQLGLAAFAILLVLACTSSNRSRRILRRAWKRLHRLSYAAGVLGALHLLGASTAWGVLYLVVVLFLLAVRLPPVKKRFLARHSPGTPADPD